MATMEQLQLEHLEPHLLKNYLVNNVDTDRAKELLSRYTKEHEEEPYSRPTAILNLLGFCCFKLHKCTGAEKYFKKCLEIDENNLNAIMNLKILYDNMHKKDMAKCYEQKVREKLDNPLNKNELKIWKARVVFEHATAMTCVDEFNSRQDRDVVKKRFNHAFILAGDELDPYEWDEWMFGFGFLYMRMDSSFNGETEHYFEEGVKCFYDVITSGGVVDVTDGEKMKRHSDRIAKAWAFMGVMMCRSKERCTKHLEEIIGSQVKQEHRGLSSVNCCEMAESLSKSTLAILRKVGDAYIKLGMMDKADDFLDKALKLQPKSGYCHQLRAQWFLKKFKDGGNSEDLDSAIQFFEDAKDNHGCNLFNLYYGLAEALKFKKDFDGAIDICFECSKGVGKYNSKLYELWAEIQEAMGDVENSKKTCGKAKKLKSGEARCDKDFGVVYCEKDCEAVRLIVNQLETDFPVCSYFYDRDSQPGDFVSDQWASMLKKCKKLIVFVSEDFVSGKRSHGHLLVDDPEIEIPVAAVRIKDYTGRLPQYLKGRTTISYSERNVERFNTDIAKFLKI